MYLIIYCNDIEIVACVAFTRIAKHSENLHVWSSLIVIDLILGNNYLNTITFILLIVVYLI